MCFNFLLPWRNFSIWSHWIATLLVLFRPSVHNSGKLFSFYPPEKLVKSTNYALAKSNKPSTRLIFSQNFEKSMYVGIEVNGNQHSTWISIKRYTKRIRKRNNLQVPRWPKSTDIKRELQCTSYEIIFLLMYFFFFGCLPRYPGLCPD